MKDKRIELIDELRHVSLRGKLSNILVRYRRTYPWVPVLGVLLTIYYHGKYGV